LKSLIAELRRRNVFRVGVAYLALSWLVIQLTSMAVPALNLPPSLNSIVFYLSMIGFPFALLFAWAFELTPDGLKRSTEVDAESSISHHTGRRIERGIFALVAVALLVLIWDKYLSEPVTAVPAVEQSAEQAPAKTAGEQSEPLKSIAVLPFVNMSDDKDYFADGLSEELLNLIAKNQDLKVAGRTSSFAFKGRNADLREIGEALNVATVLEGSVRRSGDRLRITAQLINVDDGYHLWSETYDRQMADVFDIQDEVAVAISKALQVTLGTVRPPADRPTENIEAYETYLEGLSLFAAEDLASIRRALTRFDEAVALDPAFVEAWEKRAEVAFNILGFHNRFVSESTARAHTYSLDALAVDPNLTFVQALEISTRTDNYEWIDEITGFDLAISAQPEKATARYYQIWNYIEAGYLEESLVVAERMIELDPLVARYKTRYGIALFANNQKAAARESMQPALKQGSEEASYYLFIDRLLENDEAGAIEVFKVLEQAQNRDLSAVRAVIEADFKGESPEPEILANIDFNTNIPALLDFGQGRLDEFYEVLLTSEMPDALSPVDTLIFIAMAFPDTGFTAHPGFLKLAKMKKLGMVKIWEQRGPPDMCSKASGEWLCH